MTATDYSKSTVDQQFNYKLPTGVSHDQVIAQAELEVHMRDSGAFRYERNVERLETTGRMEQTSAGVRIMDGGIPKLAQAINDYRESFTGTGRRPAALKYLKMVHTKKLAYLTLKGVLGGTMHRGKFAATAGRVGRMVEDEIRLAEIRKEDPDCYRMIQRQVEGQEVYRLRRDNLKYYARRRHEEGELDSWDEWTDRLAYLVGANLIELLRTSTGIIVYKEMTERIGRSSTPATTKHIVLTDEMLDYIAEHKEFMKGMQPVMEPMIIPPRRWETGKLFAGYLTNNVPKVKLMKTRKRESMTALRRADFPVVINALNAAQETQWKPDTQHLEVLKWCLEKGITVGKSLPSLLPRDLPPRPNGMHGERLTPEDRIEYGKWIDASEENKKAHNAWRSNSGATHTYNVEVRGRRLSLLNKITSMERFSRYWDDESWPMYFPHTLDFRGRIYPVTNGGISPQGDDVVKGFLSFARGDRIGNEGIKWFKINLANLWGVDKVSFDERIAWVDEHAEELMAQAMDPYENRGWMDADKPFQALKAQRELIGIAMNGADHITYIPCNFDGSCSGLQNLGQALRCEVTGAAVNLVPQDKPADIYQQVADRVLVMLKEMVDSKAEGWEDARDVLLLDFGRTQAKRPVMTYAYGAGQYGYVNMIQEDWLFPLRRTVQNALLDGRITEAKAAELFPFRDGGLPAAQLLGKLLWDAVRDNVKKAAEIMKWMQESARVIVKHGVLAGESGAPVTWRTPLGLPVLQKYVKEKRHRVDTELAGGLRLTVQLSEETPKMDSMKMANSVSPNVVHSLDSSHLCLVVHLAHQEGFREFSLIHDSFGTLASERTFRFFEIIREAFVMIYQEPVFENLRDQFAQQVDPKYLSEIPPLPQYGKLDENAVLESLYAFA